MAEITLSAEARTEFGKGAARRIRRADKVPAVIYGHGTDPVHITLPGHETLLALRHANSLLSISIDGAEGTLVLPKQIQRDPIKGFVEHVDLVIVRRGEKVTVDVPVIIVGDAASETVVVVEANTISLEVEATAIPNDVEVSVEGLEPGHQILGRDLVLPEGAAFAGDPESLIVNITRELSEEELEAELQVPEGEEAAEGAEDDEDEAADESDADEDDK